MSHTPARINVLTVLEDPGFPDWGKRSIREVIDKDVVDVCNVLEFLTNIWTVKCQEVLGLPLEEALNPSTYREVVEALTATTSLLNEGIPAHRTEYNAVVEQARQALARTQGTG